MQLVDSCVAIGGPKRDGESRLDGIRLHRLTGFSELFPPLWGAAQLSCNLCASARCRLVWFDPGGCVPLSAGAVGILVLPLSHPSQWMKN